MLLFYIFLILFLVSHHPGKLIQIFQVISWWIRELVLLEITYLLKSKIIKIDKSVKNLVSLRLTVIQVCLTYQDIFIIGIWQPVQLIYRVLSTCIMAFQTTFCIKTAIFCRFRGMVRLTGDCVKSPTCQHFIIPVLKLKAVLGLVFTFLLVQMGRLGVVLVRVSDISWN